MTTAEHTCVVNKTGDIEWQIRDTILVCPMAGQRFEADDNMVVASHQMRGGSTNKKQKILEIIEDQVQEPITAFAARK